MHKAFRTQAIEQLRVNNLNQRRTKNVVPVSTARSPAAPTHRVGLTPRRIKAVGTQKQWAMTAVSSGSNAPATVDALYIPGNPGKQLEIRDDQAASLPDRGLRRFLPEPGLDTVRYAAKPTFPDHRPVCRWRPQGRHNSPAARDSAPAMARPFHLVSRRIC